MKNASYDTRQSIGIEAGLRHGSRALRTIYSAAEALWHQRDTIAAECLGWDQIEGGCTPGLALCDPAKDTIPQETVRMASAGDWHHLCS